MNTFSELSFKKSYFELQRPFNYNIYECTKMDYIISFYELKAFIIRQNLQTKEREY